MSDRRPASSRKEPVSSLIGKRRAPQTSADETSKRPSPTGNPPLPPDFPLQRPQSAQQTILDSQIPDDALGVTPRPQPHRVQHQHQAGKVAIPRLPRDTDSSLTNQVEKSRVSHACEPCRQRKTKCSGEIPVCKHCEDFRITCLYADGKRDRTKKEIGNMAGKIEDYEKLLRDLSVRTSYADQSLIRNALQKDDSTDADETYLDSSSQRSRGDVIADGDIESAGEHRVSARVGSTGSLDNIDEDYNRSASARATGFLGKNSEVVWMQRLNELAHKASSRVNSGKKSGHSTELEDGRSASDHETEQHPNEEHATSDSTYHCDDLPVIVTDQVDPFELPPKNIADQFFQSYLDIVHPAFPILGKSTFISQYQTFANRENVNTGNNWRAILNLIFAIAAKYAHLVQAEWRGDERDHMIYFTRARMLGFNGDSILAHPELQQIQIAGLMAFYLTAINQINRAWGMSGFAIRHAVALGLNLQNDNEDVHEGSREIRYRVWWALCSTERMLAVMTGRPTSFSETDCSVPLPRPINEDILFKRKPQSTSQAKTKLANTLNSSHSSSAYDISPSSRGTPDKLPSSPDLVEQQSDLDSDIAASSSDAYCFLFNTKLGAVTNEVMTRLYRAGASNETWAQVQGKITDFNSEIDGWLRDLPAVFDFTRKQRDQNCLRHRLRLGFAYYSTRLIINRPALCRMDRKIPDQSGESREFNRMAAAKCVHSAKAVMEMLPKVPNPVGLYGSAPWWCLVHHLVQASTILMLELSFRADHMPNEADEILEAAKKAVVWLGSMSEENMAARRAWKMCDAMLRIVAPKIGQTVDDIPVADSPPERYGPPLFPPSPSSTLAYPLLSRQSGEVSFQGRGQLEEDPIHTSYDEFMSSSMTKPPVLSPQFYTLFPSAAQMEGFGSGGGGPTFQAGEPRWDDGGTNR